MPKQAGKILKYIHGEESLSRINLVKIIPKNLTQRKKLYHSFLVGQWLQIVDLMKKKINLSITEEKIEKLCKMLKKRAMKIINYEKKK